jgi:protein O-GlcNAc transferase
MTANARISNKAVRKGLAHLEAGRIDSAERLFNSVLLSEPRNAEANHALGALAVRQGKPQSALSFLTAALQADPQQGQHWLSFAEALLQTGAIGDARAVLERAAARGFSSPALKTRIEHAELHHHARDHHKAGRFAEAEKLYTAILAAHPAHADSLHMLGQIAHQTNHAEAAIRLISEAICLKGDVAEFHCNLGIVLAESGRLEEAKQSFERALALQSESPEAQTGLGYVYRLLGQVDEAIRRYSAVIAAGVNTAVAHNNLGGLLFDLHRMDEAVFHGTEALRQNPNFAEAHNNLGNVYRETGRLDEALREYREALRLKPGYAPAWNNIGNALKTQGKLTEAIANFRTAISLDPGFFFAHSNLIMTLGYSAEVPHDVLVDQARQFNDVVAAPLLRARVRKHA